MISFELSQGLIILPITIFYSPGVVVQAQGMIDTGSAGTALDINLLTLDPSRASRIIEISGIGGSQDVVIQKVDAATFGERKVKSFEVEFGDVETKFGFNAIVGSDLLDELGASIDYQRKEIRFPDQFVYV